MAKQRKGSPTYREHRPTDLIARPPSPGQKVSLADLPESFRTALTEAEEWPYVDPDANGLGDPELSFNDYPSDPDSLPAEIEPFSEAEPWGKMINETPREYELFSQYRSQGIARTKRATARHFDLSSIRITKVATSRNWDARVKAWDDYRERVYTMELIQGTKEMAHKHAEIARSGIEALSVAFAGIVEAMANEDDRDALLAELADMPAKHQIALAQGSARVIPNLMNAERLSRGLPTEISQEFHTHDARVTIQTTDDLADILAGIAGPLAVSRSGEPEEEIIEVDG